MITYFWPPLYLYTDQQSIILLISRNTNTVVSQISDFFRFHLYDAYTCITMGNVPDLPDLVPPKRVTVRNTHFSEKMHHLAVNSLMCSLSTNFFPHMATLYNLTSFKGRVNKFLLLKWSVSAYVQWVRPCKGKKGKFVYKKNEKILTSTCNWEASMFFKTANIRCFNTSEQSYRHAKRVWFFFNKVSIQFLWSPLPLFVHVRFWWPPIPPSAFEQTFFMTP